MTTSMAGKGSGAIVARAAKVAGKGLAMPGAHVRRARAAAAAEGSSADVRSGESARARRMSRRRGRIGLQSVENQVMRPTTFASWSRSGSPFAAAVRAETRSTTAPSFMRTWAGPLSLPVVRRRPTHSTDRAGGDDFSACGGRPSRTIASRIRASSDVARWRGRSVETSRSSQKLSSLTPGDSRACARAAVQLFM